MQPISSHSFRSVSLILNPAIHSVDTLPLRVGTTPCRETDNTMPLSQNSRPVDSPAAT